MVSRPLISILMPTHSRVDVIGIAIQSVLNQSLNDFELLVVGDGCAPGTADVVAGFHDDRIRFFDLPKAPYFGYANRNIALREARGRLIGLAADDDILLPDHFELLADCLEGGAAIAYSQALWVSTDGIAAPFMTNLEIPDELEIFMTHANSIPSSCFLYRADSLPILDAWPEDVAKAADWRLWQRIIRENPQPAVAYCRQPTVLHFAATWRKSRYSSIGQFATLLDIADDAAWWPSGLRVSVPAGQTEQQAYAALLNADPTGWTAGIRRAALDLTARLAWDDVQMVRPSSKAISDRLAAVQHELASLRAELASASARAESSEGVLALARAEIESVRADKQMLSDRLETSLADVERLSTAVERMQTSLAWRLRGVVARAWRSRRKLSEKIEI